MSTGRDWRAFNREWRNPEAEKRFDQALSVLIGIVKHPKRLWWGIFFGVLVGVLLLAPESNFSNRVRELFYTLQDSVVQFLDALTGTIETEPLFLPILILTAGLLAYATLGKTEIKINEDELEFTRMKSQEERHLILMKTILESSRSSSVISIALTFLGAMLGVMFNA